MTPPAGPGQEAVLKAHYDRIGQSPVAYLDEIYQVEREGERFYAIADVVVAHQDREPLRNELNALVPDAWWHTTDALRNDHGRERTRDCSGPFNA